jgi:hypothetical protein
VCLMHWADHHGVLQAIRKPGRQHGEESVRPQPFASVRRGQILLVATHRVPYGLGTEQGEVGVSWTHQLRGLQKELQSGERNTKLASFRPFGRLKMCNGNYKKQAEQSLRFVR